MRWSLQFALSSCCLIAICFCSTTSADSPPRTKSQRGRQQAKDKPDVPLIQGNGKPMTREKREEIRGLFKRVIEKRPVPEPLAKPRGWKWTDEKYRHALLVARLWQQKLDDEKSLGRGYWMFADLSWGAAGELQESAAELVPSYSSDWLREGYMSALPAITPDNINYFSQRHSYLLDLKDDKMRDYLKKRAAWEQRRRAFAELCKITEDKRPWSLHHPFDDLDAREMERVVEAARLAKIRYPAMVRGESAQPLSSDDFDLLIRADQMEFLMDLFVSPEERRASEAEKERQRKAAEEAAKKHEVARQRQMKIDKEEKEAKKLLRAALLLDARGDFDKQVRQRLQAIIDKYPDTPSAERAKRQLDGGGVPEVAFRSKTASLIAEAPSATASSMKKPRSQAPNLPAPREVEYRVSPSVRMVLCWIPPGECRLGSPVKEAKRIGDVVERVFSAGRETEREFSTVGFWLGKYEVTQAEWAAVMGNNPSVHDGRKPGSMAGKDTSRFPVDDISWEDVQRFVKALNALGSVKDTFGMPGRFVVPTEDEWEYACRGGKGNTDPFYFGGVLNGRQANCDGTKPYGTALPGPKLGRPTVVGSYAREYPHPWGLCDMLGNVWEFCDSDRRPAGTRVLRGGCYGDAGESCRAASRNFFGPDTNHYHNLGIRVCFRPN